MEHPQTWLLSGIPRSGTSLCCRLAGALPDTVALSEPIRRRKALEGTDTPHAARALISDFVEQTRAQIVMKRRAPTIQVGGCLDDNRVASRYTATGLRQLQGEWGEIAIDKPLSDRFTLLIKHNALFAALLPWLTPSFSCVALVRNPLAVLASWQTVDLPVHRGRIPAGEQFDHQLRQTLDQEPEVVQRQITVLDWFFARYQAYLAPGNIIRYEDLVDSGGLALSHLLGHARSRPTILKNQNSNALCDKTMIDTLLRGLLKTGGAWTQFYNPEDCERVAAGIRHER